MYWVNCHKLWSSVGNSGFGPAINKCYVKIQKDIIYRVSSALTNVDLNEAKSLSMTADICLNGNGFGLKMEAKAQLEYAESVD